MKNRSTNQWIFVLDCEHNTPFYFIVEIFKLFFDHFKLSNPSIQPTCFNLLKIIISPNNLFTYQSFIRNHIFLFRDKFKNTAIQWINDIAMLAEQVQTTETTEKTQHIIQAAICLTNHLPILR